MKFQKDLILIISKHILDKMINCVQSTAPDEAFGLVIGPQPKEISLGDSLGFQYHYLGEIFECVKSSEKSPVSFMMDNTEVLFKIIENAKRKYNRRILSIFHSHPSGAYPSGFDTKYMEFLDNFPSKVYKNQIWTIMDGLSRELNGFIYLNDELMQITIEIKD